MERCDLEVLCSDPRFVLSLEKRHEEASPNFIAFRRIPLSAKNLLDVIPQDSNNLIQPHRHNLEWRRRKLTSSLKIHHGPSSFLQKFRSKIPQIDGRFHEIPPLHLLLPHLSLRLIHVSRSKKIHRQIRVKLSHR